MSLKSITPLPSSTPAEPASTPVPDLSALRQGWSSKPTARQSLPSIPSSNSDSAFDTPALTETAKIPTLPSGLTNTDSADFNINALDSLLASVYPEQASKSPSLQTTKKPTQPAAKKEAIPQMEFAMPEDIPQPAKITLEAMPSAAEPNVSLPLVRDQFIQAEEQYATDSLITPAPPVSQRLTDKETPINEETSFIKDEPTLVKETSPTKELTDKPVPKTEPAKDPQPTEELIPAETSTEISNDDYAGEITQVQPSEERYTYTDQNLRDALRPMINDSVNKFLYTPSHGIHSYLEPMLRSTVRRAIAEQMDDISPFQDVSGWDKLAWKMRALFSSRSYEDVVFDYTKRYQVEEVFLLRRHTRSLISYASNDPSRHAQQKKVQGTVKKISAQCSSNTEDGKLATTLDWEDKRQLVIRRGEHCTLVAVVNGSSNAILKSDLDYALRQAEERFGVSLEDESDIHLQVLQPLLEGCLLIKSPAIPN